MVELIRGRYEPQEVIGRGGQGEVLRALDTLHNRQVAIKVRPVPTPEEQEAVLSETRVLLDVRPHPGLPLVREDFFLEDRYYLVMDWVEGKSLHQVLQERGDPGLAHPIVVGYLSQVAAALDHLHAHDPPIVHGDVKPANLILTPSGRVILVDFGVAVQREVRTVRMATKGFAAPELAAGRMLTPASDLYSLAATAFVLLTGEIAGPGVNSTSGSEGADWGRVAKALRRGLSTDPARRPASATDLVAGLEAWHKSGALEGTPTFFSAEIMRPAGKSQEEAGHPSSRLTEVLVASIGRHGGLLAKAKGDPAVLGAFPRATDAVQCALTVKEELDESGENSAPVRMALATGEATYQGGEYEGSSIARVLALRKMAGTGRILLSQATSELVRDLLPDGTSLNRLGPHELGFARPEQVFELSTAHSGDQAPILPPPETSPLVLSGDNENATGPQEPKPSSRIRVGFSIFGVWGLVAVVLVGLSVADVLGGGGDPLSSPAMWEIDSSMITASASSELAARQDLGLSYFAANTLDGSVGSAWATGAVAGETITYRFTRPVHLQRIYALNGYVKTEKSFKENARIRQVRVTTDQGSRLAFLGDTESWQGVPAPVGPTSQVQVELLSVYPGTKFGDVALTEIIFLERPTPDLISKAGGQSTLRGQHQPLPAGTDPIPAGDYSTTKFQPPISLSLDGSWRSFKGENGDVLDLVLTSGAKSGLLTLLRVERIFRGDLRPQTLTDNQEATTPAPADVAEWLAGHPRLEVTTRSVELGGVQGVELNLRIKPDAGYTNDRCPTRCVLLFPLDTEGRLFELVEGNDNRLHVVRVGGHTLILALEALPADFDTFRIAADKILASISFQRVGPAASPEGEVSDDVRGEFAPQAVPSSVPGWQASLMLGFSALGAVVALRRPKLPDAGGIAKRTGLALWDIGLALCAGNTLTVSLSFFASVSDTLSNPPVERWQAAEHIWPLLATVVVLAVLLRRRLLRNSLSRIIPARP